jgi:hypothetical protein
MQSATLLRRRQMGTHPKVDRLLHQYRSLLAPRPKPKSTPSPCANVVGFRARVRDLEQTVITLEARNSNLSDVLVKAARVEDR